MYLICQTYKSVSPLQYNSETEGLCQASYPKFDGTSIIFLSNSSLLKITESSTQSTFIGTLPKVFINVVAQEGYTILDFKFYLPGSVVLLLHRSSDSKDVLIISIGNTETTLALPFSYTDIENWYIVTEEPLSILFYQKNGRIFGLGFGVSAVKFNYSLSVR